MADLLVWSDAGSEDVEITGYHQEEASGSGHDDAAGAPGEILLEEFLKPLRLSQYQLSKAVDVPARRINEIVHGQRRITAGTALRLSRYLGTSERFWMNLQARYDLQTEKDRLGAALDDIRLQSAASRPQQQEAFVQRRKPGRLAA